MSDSQQLQSDLWLTVETAYNGLAEICAQTSPKKRRLNDGESLPIKKTTSDTDSNLSEVPETFGDLTPWLSPVQKPDQTADMAIRDAAPVMPTVAQEDLGTEHAFRASTDNSDATTEIDDAIKHDGVSPPSDQLVATKEHFVDPDAPLVCYELSEKTGLFEIKETPIKSFQLSNFVTWTPSRVKGTWRIQKYRGPAEFFPAHLLTVLEEWHQEYPLEAPPCQWKGRSEGAQWVNFKIFDHDGDEHDISIFKVTISHPKARKYNMTILHSENAPEVFVDCAMQCRPMNFKVSGCQCQYVFAWLGLIEGYENDSCAIRVWGPEGTDIDFKSRWFGPDQGKRAKSVKTDKHPNPATPIKGPSRRSAKLYNSDSDTMPTPYSLKQRVEYDSDEEGVVAHDPVRKILFSPPSIRFKLLSENSPNVRIFSFNEQMDSGQIFKKAREFYQDIKAPSEMALLCKVPGQQELRYIGEGCDDEFDILCDDIKRLSLHEGDVRVIEVKPA
ncbi:hypothetical protein N7520_002775 [Penicillium odoratum]|uniref:uncharacterized protein n=1 Tax=Penicillium odoratum TaxID=1167516 RepID=UPI0025496428|nr:uncharacterized protein N7520_002775 [Penicillium odoratum]KAJ5772246.1 hypothetical protein N7520_002775 [Penicillium odoratum]